LRKRTYFTFNVGCYLKAAEHHSVSACVTNSNSQICFVVRYRICIIIIIIIIIRTIYMACCVLPSPSVLPNNSFAIGDTSTWQASLTTLHVSAHLSMTIMRYNKHALRPIMPKNNAKFLCILQHSIIVLLASKLLIQVA
jgi:hypothetical protein